MLKLINKINMAALFLVCSYYTHAAQIEPNGDFRYRHESTTDETKSSGQQERHRHRIRARIGAKIKIEDSLKLNFSLATGEGDAQTSTNQTLGYNGSVQRGIYIDIAQADIKLAPHSDLKLGKIKNPIFAPGRSDLIYDSDLTPEGLFYGYENSLGEGLMFFNFGSFWLSEDASNKDLGVFHTQLGYEIKIADTGKLKTGIGQIAFTNIKGADGTVAPTLKIGNNSNDGGGRFNFDYRPIELFLEHSSDSISFYAHYIYNGEVKNQKLGYLVGLIVGKTKVKGDYSVRYNYRELQKDATISALTDGDIGGGGTDVKGHYIDLSYQVFNNATLSLVNYISSKNISTSNKSYNKYQLNFVVVF